MVEYTEVRLRWKVLKAGVWVSVLLLFVKNA